MEANIAQWERYLRVVLGVLFLSYAFAGGPSWAYLGFVPLFTGAAGVCPLFYMLSISTKKQ